MLISIKRLRREQKRSSDIAAPLERPRSVHAEAARPACLVAVFLLIAMLLSPTQAQNTGVERQLAGGDSVSGVSAGDDYAQGVDEIVAGYNAGIRRAMSIIDSLRVDQELVEPRDDGGEDQARAVLTYTRDRGMEREEIESSIGHPTGEYKLSSLVGPELRADEYAISLADVEEKDGRRCFHLEVTAKERDVDHFDGDVWVTTSGLHLVRVSGEVADPPFPVVRVGLDKAFEPEADGLWLLRRHTGDVEVHLGFVKRRGTMHIFYYDYSVTVSQPEVSGAPE